MRQERPANGGTTQNGRQRSRGAVPQPLRPDDARLTRPLLTVREVATALAVPESTFRTWARGYERRGRSQRVVGEPVVTSLPTRGREASIPFIGVAEGLVLAAFRRSGVPLQRIRPALRRLAEEIGLEHALASQRLYSDGADVLYDYAEKSHDDEVAEQLTVVRSGQRVFAEVVQDYLRLMTYANDGWPSLVRLPAFGSAVVVVDPHRAFGRPLFATGGARVEDVLDRWRAGESFAELSRDFGVPVEEIEDAARAAAARAAA
jgi:uncharacterized protein (DUF433 family)